MTAITQSTLISPMPRCTTTPKRPQTTSGPASGESLKSVAAAFDVLECFSVDDELGVSDIARRLGIAKSTAHRLLTTLCSRGMAEKNPDSGLYRLGMHLFELGQLAQARMRLRQVALPLLGDLRQATNHTVHLSVIDGPDIVHAERLYGADSPGILASLGRRFPSHCTATGKAIAAFNPDFAEARRRAGFPPRTRHTIRTTLEFDHALALARRSGVGIAHEESVAGMSSVAAPVRDLSGRAYAAVSVAAPTEILRPEVERASRLVSLAARQLSRLAAS